MTEPMSDRDLIEPLRALAEASKANVAAFGGRGPLVTLGADDLLALLDELDAARRYKSMAQGRADR